MWYSTAGFNFDSVVLVMSAAAPADALSNVQQRHSGHGGLAVRSLQSSEGVSTPPFGFCTVTGAGWTAGGGIEARIDERWSAKLEYLYVDLGSGSGFTDTYPGGAQMSETVGFSAHILRGGFHYRFSGGFNYRFN